jgi:long-chain acyl-CoA synthetase
MNEPVAGETLPRVHDTVVHMLADAAAKSAASTALVCDGRRLTYGQYVRCVACFADELVGLGARGGRVALVCGNSLEMAIALFAVHAAGAQAVPINPLYTERELHHILSDADPVIVLHDRDGVAPMADLAGQLDIAHRIVLGPGGRRLDGARDGAARELPRPLPTPGDLATLQYTGGTTGVPKGVDITHGQMAINIAQREARLPTVADDESVLCVMPLFHVFAVAMCLHLSAHARGKLVILSRYHRDGVFDALAQEVITRLPAGPTIYVGLMDHARFASTDYSHLRSCYSGSAPLPAQTLKSWTAHTGCPILEGFGQSEAGPVLTYIGADMEMIAGSVGPALARTRIEIVDVETGQQVLPVGAVGEIRARGPQIMSGYRNRPRESAQALRDGWLYTGDIGVLDSAGYLTILDRKKDMVISGGYNIYPREIDEVLTAHPDVREAAAIGVPDAYRGEVIKAFVVLKPGATATGSDLKAHCAAQLAAYKQPAVLEIVAQIARTAVGKIDRNALRKC